MKSMEKFKSLCLSLRKVSYLYEKEAFTECLGIIQEVLADPLVSGDQAVYFLHYQAVIYTLTGKRLEAIEILSKMRERFESHPYFSASLKIAADTVIEEAKKLYCEDRSASKLKHYYQILREIHYSPNWLTFATAIQEAKDGRTEEAKKMSQALLDLTPNDAECLRGCYHLAFLLEDKPWQKQLQSKIYELLEAKPYRLDLYGILPEQEDVKSDFFS